MLVGMVPDELLEGHDAVSLASMADWIRRRGSFWKPVRSDARATFVLQLSKKSCAMTLSHDERCSDLVSEMVCVRSQQSPLLITSISMPQTLIHSITKQRLLIIMLLHHLL